MSVSKHHAYKCSIAGCTAGFKDRTLKRNHENIHDNILLKCVFCPYTNAERGNLTEHQRAHFNIRDHKCEICQMEFLNKTHLATHFDQKHSGIKVKCPLCGLEGARNTVQVHLLKKHKIFGSSWSPQDQAFKLPS